MYEAKSSSITLIYSLKAIVMISYQRLAFGNWQTMLLRWTKFYCFGGYIGIFCVIHLSCWPYSSHWRVEPFSRKEFHIGYSEFII
jgi:hypothetical protein